MEKEVLHTCICEIVDLAFKRLQDVYNKCSEDKTSCESRLVFPHYRGSKKLRISEQELRFIFVEVFNQYCDLKGLELFYSIETPTLDMYEFKDTPRRSDNGQSAMFDLVIFDKYFKRRALIEFKANNADDKSHFKDIVKLNNTNEYQDGALRYFIEVVDNYNTNTIISFARKLSDANDIDIKIYSLKKAVYLKP